VSGDDHPGCLAPLIADGGGCPEWASRIKSIPPGVVKTICRDVAEVSAATREEAKAAERFLLHRHQRIMEYLSEDPATLPKVSRNGDGMRTEWVVAKYMPDLRRREPRNIGVVLRHGDQVLARVVGEKADGRIDGRILRGWGVISAENYRAWVAYWRHALLTTSDVRELLQPRADQDFVLERGGERLLGGEDTDPDASSITSTRRSLRSSRSPRLCTWPRSARR
jgi:hypothetical protein